MADQNQPAQGGGTATVQTPTVTVQTGGPAPVAIQRQEVDAFTMRLIGRFGSAENALQHLAGEQLRFRKRAQAAEKRASEAEAKLPSQDAVVLTGEEAKAFTALRTATPQFSIVGLGEQLKELGALKTKTAREERAAALNTAAGKKYKLNVLSRLLGDTPLEFKKVLQKKEDAAEGEDAMEELSVPYVKVGDTLELLDSWLAREHKEFADVLKASEEESGTSADEPTGPRMPAQRSSANTTPSKTNDLFKAIDQRMGTFAIPSKMKAASK